MGLLNLFGRRDVCSIDAFCHREVEKALGSNPGYLHEFLDGSKVVSEEQLHFYALTIPVFSMRLASFPEEFRKIYAACAADELDKRFPQSTQRYLASLRAYLAALDQDIASGQGNLMPSVITLALKGICGGSGDDLVKARIALLMYTMGDLKATVPFYRDIQQKVRFVA